MTENGQMLTAQYHHVRYAVSKLNRTTIELPSKRLSNGAPLVGLGVQKGGGGCSLIFSYICRVILWVQNFKFQYFWGSLEKNGSTPPPPHPPPPPVRGCMLTESILPNRVMKWGKGLSSIFLNTGCNHTIIVGC